MTHAFFSIQNGPTGVNPSPGIQTSSGTGFNPNFMLPSLPTTDLENTGASTAWFPFDRGIQVPSPDTWPNSEGVYFWNTNKIWIRDLGANTWTIAHTIAGMRDVLDYGVKSGLKALIGKNGRLYVAGVCPHTDGAANGMGVSLDVEANTWQESASINNNGTWDLLEAAFVHRGELYVPTNEDIVVYDPAANSCRLIVHPINPLTAKYRFFSFGQRLFMAGSGTGGDMMVWEHYAGLWLEQANLGDYEVASTGMWAILHNKQAVYILWNSNEGTASGFRMVKVAPSLPDPFSPLSITDLTDDQLQLSPYIFSTALNSNSAARLWAASDGSEYPGIDPLINLYIQAGGTYGEAWDANRFLGEQTALGDLGDPFGGAQTYMSSPFGDSPYIYNSPNIPGDQVKAVVYKVEPADDIVEHGLLISFWVFGNTDTVRVRLRHTNPFFPIQTPVRDQLGTIHSVVAGGLLNVNANRMDNVPVSTVGGGVHQLIWDRDADGYDNTQDTPFALEILV